MAAERHAPDKKPGAGATVTDHDGAQAAPPVSQGEGGLPAWLEPELATLTKDRFSDPAWIFERKLDGERCLAFADGGRVRLMTRNQHEIASTFPEIAAALAAQGRERCVVDGEIVAFDGSATRFERLQQRLGQARPSEALLAAVPAYFYLFDVLYAGNRDTRPLPLLERKQILRGLLPFDGPLRYTEHRDTEGESYYREACRLGWEGLIAKRADSPYRAGRTKDWLKFKCITGQEFVIGGFTDPQRSRIGFGALLLGYYDNSGRLIYAGKVGTGFDNQTLRSLHDRLAATERPAPAFAVGKLPRSRVHWVEPRLVGQIAFTEWTDAGELRHPRFQGLRDDKDPREVVREIPTSEEDGS
jgi:DNA ligase D-like protein (predicted ligase)